MKAILLAAGLGSRLKPLTDTIPKCLVPIKGKPLLAYWLDKLIKLGITEILINTHYKAASVEKFISNHEYRKYVTIVHEEELLDTGGTLIKNKEFWKNSTVLVAHADNFTLSTLEGLVNAHRNRSSATEATMLLFESKNPESCGIALINEEFIVTNYYEKIKFPPSNLANGATLIFSPNVYNRFFKPFENQQKLSLCGDILPTMVNQVQGWKVDNEYIDIGTPETYQLANSI